MDCPIAATPRFVIPGALKEVERLLGATIAVVEAKEPCYLQTLGASVGATVTWTKVGALPATLTLSTAGVLSGTPTKAGTYTLTVTAIEKVGTKKTSATGHFSLVVKERSMPPRHRKMLCSPGMVSS